MTPTPNTPNEVDELRNMIDDIGSAGNDMWHADSLGFYMAKIQALITKQQALYHAAGLRELRKEFDMIPTDIAGMIGLDEYALGRTKEEVQWAKDKNRAQSIAAMHIQATIDKTIAREEGK